MHYSGSVPFGHGSIGHHQPQRPVPRSFPLFKRCEWLVSNRFVSKWRLPHYSYIATVPQFSAIILENLIGTVFQVTQNCSTLLTMCKWKGTIDQCDRHFKQSLSRDGLCCSFNYYTFPDTTTLDKYKHYFCRTEREF